MKSFVIYGNNLRQIPEITLFE